MNSSWVQGAAESSYDVDNLPYGVFTRGEEPPRVGVRIGDFVLDLAPVAAGEMLESAHVFEAPSLNPLLALGRPAWQSVRSWLVGLLTDETERDLVEPNLVPDGEVQMRMPLEVADYDHFYC
jgi:fumarylacetoacetase